MPGPPGSNTTVEKVSTTSTTTLMLPQLGEAEGRLQTQSDTPYDPTQNAQDQLSAEKGQAREDEEWLENPVHPRNWSSKRKWVNMAIVSRYLDPRQDRS